MEQLRNGRSRLAGGADRGPVHQGGGADRLRETRRRHAEAAGQGHPCDCRRRAQPVRQPRRSGRRGAALRRLHEGSARQRRPRHVRRRRRRPARRRREHADRLPVRPRVRRVRGERARPRRRRPRSRNTGPGYENFGDGCRQRSGAVAAHISTEEAARDMDVVRSLLGSQTLDWFGASYGTQLGATYATLFPQNVGRMVLDGAVDPTLSSEESAFGQTTGLPARARRVHQRLRQEGDLPARPRR